jgi:hypothetical protein
LTPPLLSNVKRRVIRCTKQTVNLVTFVPRNRSRLILTKIITSRLISAIVLVLAVLSGDPLSLGSPLFIHHKSEITITRTYVCIDKNVINAVNTQIFGESSSDTSTKSFR